MASDKIGDVAGRRMIRRGIARTAPIPTVLVVVAVAAVAAVLGGCGGREVTMPGPEAVPRPSFLDAPEDLSQSFQLGAIPERDVAGLPPPADGAATEWLTGALAALAQVEPAPTTLSRLSIYEGSVHFAFPDPQVPGRMLGGFYREGDGLSISEPRFDDSPTYELALVRPDVPTRIRTAIEDRFPAVTVTDFELSPGLSYEFGLVWYVTVADARGTLATVFADVDGAIVAVDEW